MNKTSASAAPVDPSLEKLSAQVLSVEEAEAPPPTQPPLQAPRWVPDEAATHCKACNYKFNLFVRKHHCRLCGNIFCNSCAKPRKWKETEARLCDGCWKSEQGIQPAATPQATPPPELLLEPEPVTPAASASASAEPGAKSMSDLW